MIPNYYIIGKFCGELTIRSKTEARRLVREYTKTMKALGRHHPLGKSIRRTVEQLNKYVKG